MRGSEDQHAKRGKGQPGCAVLPSRTAGDPQLSVVIPAYNQAGYLRETLSSVLAQADDAVEVIVVNDGSTDATPAVVAEFPGRVRCINQRNAGLAAARNRGHAEARGEFIAWLDADDLCMPDRLHLQAEVLRRYPDVGVVSTGFSAFDARGTIATSYAGRYYKQISEPGLRDLYPVAETLEVDRDGDRLAVPLHRGSIYPAVAYGNFVHPPTVMMRRAVVSELGELKVDIPSCADWEFFVRASRRFNFAYLDVPLLRYRISAGQMSNPANSLRHVPREIRAFEAMLAADPSLLTERERIRRLYRSWYFTLATASSSENRVGALGYLLRSLYYGCPPPQFAKAAVKLALPDFLLAAIQRAGRSLRRLSARDG